MRNILKVLILIVFSSCMVEKGYKTKIRIANKASLDLKIIFFDNEKMDQLHIKSHTSVDTIVFNDDGAMEIFEFKDSVIVVFDDLKEFHYSAKDTCDIQNSLYCKSSFICEEEDKFNNFCLFTFSEYDYNLAR